MAITVACPSCGTNLRAADDKAGRKAKCPKCGTVLTFPSAIQEIPIRRADPLTARPKASPRAQAPLPPAGGSTCSCPHCGHTRIPFKIEDANTVFECRKCGGKFTPKGGAVAKADVEITQPEELVQPAERKEKACPFCGESILAVAKKCRHCGEMLDVDARPPPIGAAGAPMTIRGAEEVSLPCPDCKRRVLARRPACNNLAHALISLFLCGLWLPIWLFAALEANSKPFLCPNCGANLGRRGRTGRTSASSTFTIVFVVLMIMLITLVVWWVDQLRQGR